jgi:hypothetical protein
MPDDLQPKGRLNTVLIVLICIAAIPIVPYLILLMAVVEESVIGTHYIQSIMERAGTIDFFRWLS